MRTPSLLIACILLTACGASSQFIRHKPMPDHAFVVGLQYDDEDVRIKKDESFSIIYITAVDGRPASSHPKKFVHSMPLSPGQHRLNVVCFFTFAGMRNVSYGAVDLNVEANRTYYLDKEVQGETPCSIQTRSVSGLHTRRVWENTQP